MIQRVTCTALAVAFAETLENCVRVAPRKAELTLTAPHFITLVDKAAAPLAEEIVGKFVGINYVVVLSHARMSDVVS